MNAEPDGLNINDCCGSTNLEPLKAAVVAHGADLGLAHDGDADRCLAVDATGAVIDGDAIATVLALAVQEAGELSSDTLVATVMSNLGLHLAMRDAGIEVRTTGVGDRYVLEELRAGEFALGGEQSGHIVMPAFGTTGDGILTGLRLMSRMAETLVPRGTGLADAIIPQVLINVEVADKPPSPRLQRFRARCGKRKWNWARPVEFSCGPPALSKSCESWLKRPTRTPRSKGPPGREVGQRAGLKPGL